MRSSSTTVKYRDFYLSIDIRLKYSFVYQGNYYKRRHLAKRVIL